METKNPRRSRAHLLIGSLIILVGIVALLDNLDVIDGWEIFRFWPVIFILFGYFKVRDAMTTMGRIIGLLFVAVGVLLVLDQFYYIHFHVWDWWPLVLILIGAGLLMNRTTLKARSSGDNLPRSSPIDPDAVISLFAFMGGFKRLCNSQEFLGGEITAVMGGCEVDLRQALMKNDTATITIFALWGGITLRVPKEWSVSVQGVPIMGGIDDKTTPVLTEPKKQLIIRGQVIMAGAELSN